MLHPVRIDSRWLRRAVLALAAVWLHSAVGGSSDLPRPLVTRVGVEYALAGHAAAFAETGIPAVKYMPETYAWGNMQSSPDAAIDFRVTDRYVREFQQAGFEELVLTLRSKSTWASVSCGLLACDQPQPKPEHLELYATWVASVVERYDGDGVDDLEDLRRPIRIVEIGSEFSSYEPEPVEDYLGMLEVAARAARDAHPGVLIAHAAFLTTGAFVGHPDPEGYEEAFAAVDRRIMHHSLADIRAVLDRPDLFDLVNFHALGDPPEIEDTVAWLEWEMDQRGYRREIIISDTVNTSFIGWGPATRCTGAVEQLGIIAPPATEADRCRLAEFFQRMIAADQPTLEWAYGFAAEDLVKRVIIACEQGVLLIDTWSTEDIPVAMLPIFQAAAGLSAWGGMVEATQNFWTGERVVHHRRPAFYALKHLMGHLASAETIRHVESADPRARIYELDGEPRSWVVWLDAGELLLPGDPVPSATVALDTGGGRFTIETTPTRTGQEEPDIEVVHGEDTTLHLEVGTTPVIVIGPTTAPTPRRGGARVGHP